MSVCTYTLTWTVCHFFVSLLLTAASTKAEDALISLQRKVKAHRIQANDQIKAKPWLNLKSGANGTKQRISN